MAETTRISMSLRDRLTITLIAGAAALAFLVFAMVRNYATQIALNAQDSILGASVTSILDAAVLRDGRIEVDFPYASFAMLDTESDDRVFYAIHGDGKLLSGYADLPAPANPDPGQAFTTGTYNGNEVRVASASRVLIGNSARTRIRVTVAQTQDALSGTLGQISRNAGVMGGAFFAFAALVSVWAVSRTVDPLNRLTRSVARRGPKDLTPVAGPVPTELVPLVTSLNTLMARLDHSLNQSEDFIAEAAHRVRTPLATVRSYADATLHRVDRPENRQALRAMIRAIDEGSRAAGQLLDHAMATFRADRLKTQPLDLVDLVNALVDRLSPIAELRDVTIRVSGATSVAVVGDPILLQNAVRNLIENALKYSPEDQTIVVTVSDGPPRVIVRDNGPGFPPDDIAIVTERIARGSNATDVIGSGLGLTIVKDVAIAHGGDLSVANADGGGACVTLHL